MSDIINIALIEENFFKNYKSVNGFRDLKQENIEFIKKLSNNLQNDSFSNNKLLNYIKTMQFLTSAKARICSPEYKEKYKLYFNNYDEAVYFLIYTLDPECDIYNIFIHGNNEKRIEEKIREKFSFFNKYIIYFEKCFIAHFSKSLIQNVKQDFSSYFIFYCGIIKNFKGITQERFDEIKKISINWRKNQPEDNKIQTCFFNAFIQKDLLNLKTEKEILLFVILSLDPNLSLLQIFEDESNYKEIEKRAKQEIGFYVPAAIKLEDSIYNLFDTDFNIYYWSKQKKV